MDNNNFGKFIVELRKEKGLTQQQLAEKLYITDKAVSKWERGLSFPDITILKSLAEILEVDVSELLNCKKGNKENVDIQKAIDEAVKNIEKIRKEKIKKKVIIITVLVIIITLTTFIIFYQYNKYHPKVILDGENSYAIGKYNLTENGLDKMIEIIQKSDNMVEKYTVSYFEARVDKVGNVEKFTLSLNIFDENEEYVGSASYWYNENKLSYNKPEKNTLNIVEDYDENSSIEYISKCIKKIPLKKQIEMSDLKWYVIGYRPNTRLEEGTPIFDMRLGIKEPLNKEDYASGKGGTSNGNTNVVIRLNDGSGFFTDEQYLYVFNVIDTEVPNNPDYMMDADYYINNGTLKFTRNYGKTWIETDITEKQLNETLEFHNNSLSLPVNSWFMTQNQYLPIAYFYGEKPTLKLTFDNGRSWEEIKFHKTKEFGNYITRRVVGFSTMNFGYVALGTDYHKESGEEKKMYVTYDYGKTWEERELPLRGRKNTLVDLYMYDENNGVLILDDEVDVNFPLIYATKNGGKTWQEIKLSYFNLPDEITYLVDIDSITKERDEYIITLGQGELGTLKAVFKTNDLTNPWNFSKTMRKNIHTVG